MRRQAESRKRLRSSNSEESHSRKSHALMEQPYSVSASSLADLFTDQKRFSTIQRKLAQYLAIEDIVNLTRTCKRLSSFYRRLVPTQWNLHQHLNRFVEDPLKLRKVLGACDGLISGSVALQFFERVVWPESDLDIYVQTGRSRPVEDYLLNQEGYRLVERKELDRYGSLDVEVVFRYERSSPSGMSEVQVVLVPGSPVASILNNFYMTAVINIISPNKAFAIFPHQTFIQKQSFLLRELDKHDEEALQKYKRRGWTIGDLPESQADSAGNHAVNGDRWVEDNKCWTIALEPPVTVNGSKSGSVLECCNFRVSQSRTQNQVSREIDIQCVEFQHLLLQGQYTYGNPAWQPYLDKKLKQAASAEVTKLDNDEQMPGALQKSKGKTRAHQPATSTKGTHSKGHSGAKRAALDGSGTTLKPKYLDDVVPSIRMEFTKEGEREEGLKRKSESSKNGAADDAKSATGSVSRLL